MAATAIDFACSTVHSLVGDPISGRSSRSYLALRAAPLEARPILFSGHSQRPSRAPARPAIRISHAVHPAARAAAAAPARARRSALARVATLSHLAAIATTWVAPV